MLAQHVDMVPPTTNGAHLYFRQNIEDVYFFKNKIRHIFGRLQTVFSTLKHACNAHQPITIEAV